MWLGITEDELEEVVVAIVGEAELEDLAADVVGEGARGGGEVFGDSGGEGGVVGVFVAEVEDGVAVVVDMVVGVGSAGAG